MTIDTISSITENIWRETFTTRHYEIKNTNNDLTILKYFRTIAKFQYTQKAKLTAPLLPAGNVDFISQARKKHHYSLTSWFK